MGLRALAPLRASARGALSSRLAASLTVAVTAIWIYLPSLHDGLVWEDSYLLKTSGVGGDTLAACFSRTFTDAWYRPIIAASLWLDHRLWGANSFAYHRTNVLIHAVTALALMGLLETTLQSRRAAFLGGLLFAVDPVHLMSVAWLGGRTDALCGLWTTLFAWALACAARSVGARRWVLLGFSSLAFLLAALTKELVLPCLLLAPLAFRCWSAETGSRLRRSALLATTPYLLVALLAIALYLRFGTYGDRLAGGDVGFVTASVLRTTCYYALLLFAPSARWIHTVSLGAFVSVGAWALGAGLLILVAAAVGFRAALRLAPSAAWFLALIVLALAAVSNMIPAGSSAVACYRAAPAGVGAAALLGWLLDLWMTRARKSVAGAARLVPFAVCAALVAWWGLLTASDMPCWSDQVLLSRMFVRCDPDSIFPRISLWDGLMKEIPGSPETPVKRGERPEQVQLVRERLCREAVSELDAGMTRIFRSDSWRQPADAVRALDRDSRILERVRECDGAGLAPRVRISQMFLRLGSVLHMLHGYGEARSSYRTALGVLHDDVWIAQGRSRRGARRTPVVRRRPVRPTP